MQEHRFHLVVEFLFYRVEEVVPEKVEIMVH